jgi:hypothetical protein
MSKILNICIGHKPFPSQYTHYFDYMLSPFPLSTEGRVIVVPRNLFGENGPALSEYAELFWLLENLNQVLRDETHIRVFHYRRFVSDGQTGLGDACSLPYAKVVKENQLELFSQDFARLAGGEIVNTPTRFAGGILGHYARHHHLEDFLDFAKFLSRENILSVLEIAQFLRGDILIPGSNIGVLSIENFRGVFSVLAKASNFVNEANYVARAGYQRRNIGFMLERLNSYLLLKGINEGKIARKTGFHMVISDSPRIGPSGDIFAAQEGRV